VSRWAKKARLEATAERRAARDLVMPAVEIGIIVPGGGPADEAYQSWDSAHRQWSIFNQAGQLLRTKKGPPVRALPRKEA
jgi:hypothetical protein